MKIIAVDDEAIALEGLVDAIHDVVPDAELNGFEYPDEALEFMNKHGCDIAFLDIEMVGVNGVELAKQMKLINPDINIIFTTGFAGYYKEAFEIRASGYIDKPITANKVYREIHDLRRPIPEGLKVQTFGNFEAFMGGKPIYFKYTKTKELLAYLVDRKGEMCTKHELLEAIFDTVEGHESYLKSLRRDLIETFNKLGCNDALVNQRGKLGVIPEKIDCDYYDLCNGIYDYNSWNGEYMTQYSWGEFTVGVIAKMTKIHF